ncbi:MAG: NAD(P)-dependent alcohol dehydrogenase [Oceanospirillaceae bacterium]|nr:NAD(P)-dependent alcohol dehydrogenase [Oceanospirillaceae bacterium]
MKAIVRESYGNAQVLELKEVPVPKVGPKEVLVKVLAASVNKADVYMMQGKPFPLRFSIGLFKPKTIGLGADVAGIVESIGTDVSQFKVGDEVFGDLSAGVFGSFAEYAVASEESLALKPTGSSFEEAAALPMAAVTALQGLRDADFVKSGDRVLINGASGGVGSYAIQIAKIHGAEVTAVCSSRNVEQALRLGADFVIDYTKEDFTKGEKEYSVIFDMVANHKVANLSKVLTKGGSYACGAFSTDLLLNSWKFKKRNQRSKLFMAKPTRSDLQLIAKWVEEGKLKAVIQKAYSLDDTPEAMERIQKGGMSGKLVVEV